jgi:hypothetical protein
MNRSARVLGITTVFGALLAAASAGAALTNDDCMMCHADAELTRENGEGLGVDPEAYGASIHGWLSCTDCHVDLSGEDAEIPHDAELEPPNCTGCHADAVELYEQGIHAHARSNGTPTAAGCADCHGAHDIKPADDPTSRTYHQNLPETCGSCHGNSRLILEAEIEAGDVASQFHDSIHGRALIEKGLVVAPNCSDCHRAHDVLRAANPDSPVSRENVPSTCGKCHVGITPVYEKSIHGKAVAEGNPGAPTCVECHTAHAIGPVETSGWQLEVLSECGSCHAESLRTYRDTFHGQVTALGFTRVAKCSDCHGFHDVLSEANPASRISEGRRVETCRQCHPGVNANFAAYDPHADKRDFDRNPFLHLAYKFMQFLLIGVFAFFGLHTALWFGRSLVEVRSRKRGN